MRMLLLGKSPHTTGFWGNKCGDAGIPGGTRCAVELWQQSTTVGIMDSNSPISNSPSFPGVLMLAFLAARGVPVVVVAAAAATAALAAAAGSAFAPALAVRFGGLYP